MTVAWRFNFAEAIQGVKNTRGSEEIRVSPNMTFTFFFPFLSGVNKCNLFHSSEFRADVSFELLPILFVSVTEAATAGDGLQQLSQLLHREEDWTRAV